MRELGDRWKTIAGIAGLVVLAVLLLRPDGLVTRDGSGAVTEDDVPTRMVGESIFDSSAHPHGQNGRGRQAS